MFRFLIFAKVLLKLAIHTNGGNIIVQSYANKILVGYNYDNISIKTHVECLQHCLADCVCLSFQTCHLHAVCQLSSSHRYLNSTAFQDSEDCDYQDFEYNKNAVQCTKGCLSDVNCCLTSKPCLHGGTCVPLFLPDQKRFKCKCPDGYEGERCEKKRCEPGYTGENCQHPISSCKGYKNGNRVNGYYTVLDDELKAYQVYCYFENPGSRAWTLIQSYSFMNRENFSMPFFQNTPVNEDRPSWEDYRLSHSRMIRSFHDSQIKWSITCNFNTEGWVLKDFVKVSVSSYNPLSRLDDGSKCINVDQVNIRGHECFQCEVYVMQKDNRALHFRPHRSINKCNFSITELERCNDNWEQSFGLYSCFNTDHRCSSSPNSTTQMWLGSTL